MSPGTPAAGHETDLELTWNVPVTDWFTLQPDLQVILNPVDNLNHDTSVALTLQLNMAW